MAFLICACILLFHLFRLFRLGSPEDFAPPAGNVKEATLYSFTGAMSPLKKESAFLHLPTYTAGIIYHLGTFISLFLMFFMWADFVFPKPLAGGLASFMLISSGCGASILIKRFVNQGLRHLSSPDDYISNILVTAFQVISGLILLFPGLFASAYFIIAALLLLYIPVGKLKHLLYFFFARMQLGFFFGSRGVWPPQSNTINPGKPRPKVPPQGGELTRRD
ncbi:MAG: hypothetical protein WCI48_03620 [Bacteroidota bacterium]